jgi:hypothetical protein
VVLVGVEHNEAIAVDISLVGEGQLKGMASAPLVQARRRIRIRRAPGRHRQDERPLRRRIVHRIAD